MPRPRCGPSRAPSLSTTNLRTSTKILDFREFDSSRIVSVRGGIHVHREFPGKFESRNLSRDNLSIGRLGAPSAKRVAGRTRWSAPCRAHAHVRGARGHLAIHDGIRRFGDVRRNPYVPPSECAATSDVGQPIGDSRLAFRAAPRARDPCAPGCAAASAEH